jgi:hypothetical protein
MSPRPRSNKPVQEVPARPTPGAAEGDAETIEEDLREKEAADKDDEQSNR